MAGNANRFNNEMDLLNKMMDDSETKINKLKKEQSQESNLANLYYAGEVDGGNAKHYESNVKISRCKQNQ